MQSFYQKLLNFSLSLDILRFCLSALEYFMYYFYNLLLKIKNFLCTNRVVDSAEQSENSTTYQIHINQACHGGGRAQGSLASLVKAMRTFG